MKKEGSQMPNPDGNPTKQKAPVREPGKEEKMVLRASDVSAGPSSGKKKGGGGVASSGHRSLADRTSPPTVPKKEGTEMGVRTEKRIPRKNPA